MRRLAHGLFWLTDGLALGALRELAAAGVRVPDDVAVIGFDNIGESRYSVPSLTTVDAGCSSRRSGSSSGSPPGWSRRTRLRKSVFPQGPTGCRSRSPAWFAANLEVHIKRTGVLQMRVVVTGGTGRAGRWVVRLLAEAGHEVVNLDVVDRPELELPGEFCRVDLADAGKVYDALFQFRPEGICHLAANPAPTGQAQIDVFDNNVMSAHNLMQAAGDLGVSRVVYASSEMATGLLTEGKTPTQIPFDETERHPSPNAYALSKYLSEVIADSLAVRYPQTAWVGLRINNVIPPDGYERFAAEWEDPGLSKANFWSYIDARDVGTAYRAALEGTSGGHEVCLVAAADTRAKRGLRELMAEFYDGYDRFTSDYEDPRSAFDCAKMKALFGWTPSYSWRDQ